MLITFVPFDAALVGLFCIFGLSSSVEIFLGALWPGQSQQASEEHFQFSWEQRLITDHQSSAVIRNLVVEIRTEIIQIQIKITMFI